MVVVTDLGEMIWNSWVIQGKNILPTLQIQVNSRYNVFLNPWRKGSDQKRMLPVNFSLFLFSSCTRKEGSKSTNWAYILRDAIHTQLHTYRDNHNKNFNPPTHYFIVKCGILQQSKLIFWVGFIVAISNPPTHYRDYHHKYGKLSMDGIP